MLLRTYKLEGVSSEVGQTDHYRAKKSWDGRMHDNNSLATQNTGFWIKMPINNVCTEDVRPETGARIFFPACKRDMFPRMPRTFSALKFCHSLRVKSECNKTILISQQN